MKPAPPAPAPETGPAAEPDKPSWAELQSAFLGIFERDFYTNHGPLEQALDAALADFLAVRHAVCVVNGTTAWMLALRALDLQGEAVIARSAGSTPLQALRWAGLQPVFSDADPGTHTLTVERAVGAITPGTSAILAVHDGDGLADPRGLEALARSRQLRLIFDATAALGHSVAGRRIGGFGDAEIFAFPAPSAMGWARGGCIATNDDTLAARLRAMRSFHDHAADAAGPRLRMNAKLSEAQAAGLLLALRQLDQP